MYQLIRIALLLALVALVLADWPIDKCKRSTPHSAVQCSRNEDCNCVSDRPGYATCRLGLCFCNPKQGFDGNATLSSPCRCDAPKQVTVVGDRKGQIPTAYCVDPVAAANSAFEEARCERLKAKVTRLYELTIFPNPIGVMTGAINLNDIFHPDSQARITPLGVYTGQVGVQEYFYGLPSSPVTNIVSIDVPWIICEGLEVSILVNFLFSSPGGIPATLFNLTEHGLFTFNEGELVVNTEGTIVNLGTIIDPHDTVIGNVTVPAELILEQTIVSVCQVMTTGVFVNGQQVSQPTCVGPNQNYDNFTDCYTFMKSIPQGSWYRANSNTFSCRQLHSLLTPYRPDVHCVHAGKTGGDKCIDFTYNSYYTQGPFVGNPLGL